MDIFFLHLLSIYFPFWEEAPNFDWGCIHSLCSVHPFGWSAVFSSRKQSMRPNPAMLNTPCLDTESGRGCACLGRVEQCSLMIFNLKGYRSKLLEMARHPRVGWGIRGAVGEWSQHKAKGAKIWVRETELTESPWHQLGTGWNWILNLFQHVKFLVTWTNPFSLHFLKSDCIGFSVSCNRKNLNW